MPHAVRLIRLFAVVLALGIAGCASTGGERNALIEAQAAWSAAIRWGGVENALTLVDPVRPAPTAVELERYRQVQISSYRDVGASSDVAAGAAVRDVEIGVIGRHTQAERSVRHRETWRYDAAAKRWWNTSGLPDLWDGR